MYCIFLILSYAVPPNLSLVNSKADKLWVNKGDFYFSSRSSKS